MTGSIQHIIQHLFQQPSLQSVTVEEAQRMADQHPSFGVAQYLLLKKMQETGHPGFTDQLQKTTLYFYNPLWLSYLLQQEPETVEAFDAFTAAGPGPSESEHAEEKTAAVLPAVTGETAPEAAPSGEQNRVVATDEFVNPPGAFAMPEPGAVQTAETKQGENGGSGAGGDGTGQTATGAIPQPGQKERPVIIETAFAKSDTLFEPYHTIDYFASQGIKLDRLDPNAQDKLGRQLRSFTDWLRSMKKLPQAAIEKELAKQDESEVLNAAAHSIEKKEVLTETMAEVYEKQGLRDKAADIYRKLSLLNPSKTAYFAAKIEALNKL